MDKALHVFIKLSDLERTKRSIRRAMAIDEKKKRTGERLGKLFKVKDQTNPDDSVEPERLTRLDEQSESPESGIGKQIEWVDTLREVEQCIENWWKG